MTEAEMRDQEETHALFERFNTRYGKCFEEMDNDIERIPQSLTPEEFEEKLETLYNVHKEQFLEMYREQWQEKHKNA